MKAFGDDGLTYCENCQKRVPDTYYVKFPAVDYRQEQWFCEMCSRKFYAWKKGEITISQLFDRRFVL